ncbi:MAG TPA: hypothetical protein VFQ92_09990 [Blastocatellia bacterium]|nr:hypothetical protein [Blastocatellia bacterium]
MASIPNYLSEVYSEDLYSISESDYDEVIATPAVEDGWQGYSEWSAEVEADQKKQEAAPSTLYIDPKDGKVKQIPEPKSLGRIDGIEL